jgi:hypothetical protein
MQPRPDPTFDMIDKAPRMTKGRARRRFMNADFFNEKSKPLLPLQRPLRSHAPRLVFLMLLH